jgi:hypothetical protein
LRDCLGGAAKLRKIGGAGSTWRWNPPDARAPPSAAILRQLYRQI